MKISIIVPVYNVEAYLDKCLNSLVNQTLKEIEIIVVNDGSPDNSKEIIKKYAKKYPKKIISLEKENGGVSSSRNYGLKHASGEYIGFIDSDDFVELDMFEKMYQKAKEKDFDIVMCDIKYIYPNKEKIAYCNLKKDLENKEDVKKNICFLYPVVWNKIYKKEKLKNIAFKENIWYEDVEFNFRVYPRINSIGYVKEAFINYVQRDSSIMKTVDKRLFNYIDNFNGLIEYYKKNNYYDTYFKELEYSYVRYLYATFIRQISYTNDDELFQKAISEAITNVNKYFPNYRQNDYLKTFSVKSLYLKYFNSTFARILHLKNKKRS